MNQDELIERLKEVAEYDGWRLRNYENSILCHKKDEVWDISDLRYHTSFDWSVPVWSKAIKESNKLDVIFVKELMNGSTFIDQNDPLQFFINLSDLIREIKKYK